MKKLLIILIIAFAACTSKVKTGQQDNENGKAQDHTEMGVPLNNGNKWKADETTKKNVADLIQVVNDSVYADAAQRNLLYTTLQTKIDTLVNECRMQGAEHDALHVWLQIVLKDMKELKNGEGEYKEVFANLKKDIESFNDFFE